MILTGPYHLKNNSVKLPPSKSESVRVAIASALAGKTRETEIIPNEDVASANRAGRHLFSCLNSDNPRCEVDCGESGIVLNISAFIGSISGKEVRLKKNKTLQTRNISPLLNALEKCDIQFIDTDDSLTVRSAIKTGHIEVSAANSTQAATGLLFALPYSDTDTELLLSEINDSAGYIDTTIEILKYFGIEIREIEHPSPEKKSFFIPGKQDFRVPGNPFRVSPDASSLPTYAAIAALTGCIEIETGICSIDIQKRTDEFIAHALHDNADIGFDSASGRISRICPCAREPFQIDASGFPDTIPILAAYAASLPGESLIKGIARLRFKESNRAEIIKKEFEKTGAKIDIDYIADTLTIAGNHLHSCTIDTRNDHRIAFAAAVLPAASDIEIEITNPGCVAKTDPDFWKNLHRLTGAVFLNK